MIEKQELIESINTWAPGKYDRALLDKQSESQLRNILASEIETFTEEQQERLLEAEATRAVQKAAFELSISEARKPLLYQERLALEKQNRAVFVSAAKQFGFSEAEANLSVLQSALGELTTWNIQKWVEERPETLLAATAQELQEREAERVKLHNERLLKANPIELKQAARQEAEDRRALAQQEYVRQQDQAGREREAAAGKPLLPQVNNLGEKLDAAFFNKLEVTNREEYRRYVKTFGANQVVDRIRGIR